jgi:hypothetical protein
VEDGGESAESQEGEFGAEVSAFLSGPACVRAPARSRAHAHTFGSFGAGLLLNSKRAIGRRGDIKATIRDG